MANIKVNPNSFIPSGEMIRELANQSYISESDVKTILRQRGIFTPTNNKDKTVSILSCLLLSPPEFEVLVERQTVKEDNLKSAGSGKIAVNSTFTNLTSFIHDNYIPDLVSQLSPKSESLKNNFKIVGVPIVKTIEKDKEIEVEINIERSNYNKSWVNHKSQFKGIVNFKHDQNEVTFQRFFTSNESKAVVEKSVSIFEKKCKELKLIDEKQLEHRIRFNDFNNDERIQFFLKIYNSDESRSLSIEGLDVSLFEFAPDTSLSLPSELKWMDNKEELIFRGKRVETTFFLNEIKYYQHLIVWRMQAVFKFELVGRGVKGKVKVDFNFHEYFKDKSHKAPLEINILSALDLENGTNLTLSQKETAKKEILTKLETIKSAIYNKHFSK
ncbi:hypothetical protein EWM62_16180 [Mucilaginibacter terrigena]|uniref:GAPS4b N-terminal domain-containing protein n=1 Tax=Mucilaginibacter terrigena TaxID=2492395 RepID=A0A4Q5LHS0_9SPHI|nr:hypothetical protein [Mucilaginibacter terrigena]RYU87251.1 hypothetical protein EWM62_16180 [Mucilaginibacter terrigena]